MGSAINTYTIMKTSHLLSISYIIVTLLFSQSFLSCRKPLLPGPTGEQGEKGDKGQKGEDGQKGDPGAGGGIGNVYYSDWAYYSFEGLSSGYWRYTVAEPAISNDIITKGTIVVYFKRNNRVYKVDYLTDTESLTQRIELGQIWLYSSWNPSDGTMFRYVIIPPTASSNSSSNKSSAKMNTKTLQQASLAINLDDYYEVCEILDIEP